MFEELLLDKTLFSFRKFLLHEHWENSDGSLVISNNAGFSGYNYSWDYMFPAHDILSQKPYSSKYQAILAAKQELQNTESIIDIDTETFSRRSEASFIIVSPFYPDNMIVPFEIIGKSGRWEFYNTKTLNAELLSSIKSLHSYKIDKNLVFKTRKACLEFLLNFVADNLEQLYDQKNYQLSQNILNKNNKKDFSDTEIRQLQKTWWMEFIKPEIDLTTIFSK